MRPLRAALKQILPPGLLVRARALDQLLHGSPELRHLDGLCDPGRNSLDIGANVGVYTYLMRRYSAHVYAYEPNPELAASLRAAFDHRVTVVEAALSDRAGKAELRIPHYQGVRMHALASVSQRFEDAEAVDMVEVSMVKLDDQGHDNVGFIKIDVEQHEREVLHGAMRTIERDWPNLLVEVTPKLYDCSLKEFFKDVLAVGYRGCFFFQGEVTRLEDYDMDVHNAGRNYGHKGCYVTNIVLVPEAASWPAPRA